jgi:hypothetical protein
MPEEGDERLQRLLGVRAVERVALCNPEQAGAPFK